MKKILLIGLVVTAVTSIVAVSIYRRNASMPI